MQVKILTGDNDIVTRKICHEVGLPVDRIVLGSEIEALSTDELADLAETRDRVRQGLAGAEGGDHRRPAPQGARRRLPRRRHQRRSGAEGRRCRHLGGHAPSTSPRNPPTSSCSRRAWRCSARACIEGRKVFGNITKYIKMGASSNFGNMFSVLGASIFLPFLPMAPIQVLTNNLLYDFSQTTIPTDNVDAEYLAVPRRWDIGNISKFVLFIGPISSIFDYVTFFMMLYVLQRLEQSRAVPDRLVRGVAAHPDADHPHHPHGQDSVSGKPGQCGADRDDHHHCRVRDRPAVHLARRHFWASSRCLRPIGSRSV